MSPHSTTHTTDEFVLDPAALHKDLLDRAQKLLTDLTAYSELLQQAKHHTPVDIRPFHNGVKSEYKSLERAFKAANGLSIEDESMSDVEERRSHILRSSNLPFYETIWSIARQERGVLALEKRMHWDATDPLANGLTKEQYMTDKTTRRHRRQHRKMNSALVDIVSDDGATWIKVSTVTEKRLLFELAKEGWHSSDEDSDYDLDDQNGMVSGTDSILEDLEIVKLVDDLRTAAQATRTNYRHPEVKIILSRVQEGSMKEVDAILARLRASGATLVCSDNAVNSVVTTQSPNNYLSMLPSELPSLTPTLNIDCTILLALLSDISHVRAEDLPPPPHRSKHYHMAIERQINEETSHPLLPTELYDLLGGHEMVCTVEAAKRMREIVNMMGTPSEKERAAVLVKSLDQDVNEEKSRSMMQQLSAHVLPRNLRLPITEVQSAYFTTGSDIPVLRQSRIRTMAASVTKAMDLSLINRSVFFHGWLSKITTITSNRAVAAGIEKEVNNFLDVYESAYGADICPADEDIGPMIRVCTTARSLIGKEKGKKEDFNNLR